jgi:hypothetical protein
VRGATFGCAAGVLVAVVVAEVVVEVVLAAVLLLGLDPQPATPMARAAMAIAARLMNAVRCMTYLLSDCRRDDLSANRSPASAD